MQCVIGMDIQRTFAEVVFWEADRLRPAGRIDMTRSGLEGFGRSLGKEDEVHRGNRQRDGGGAGAQPVCSASDRCQSGTSEGDCTCSRQPEVWLPDAETELRRRLVARRNQVVRHRTQERGAFHSSAASYPGRAHMPPCSAGWVGLWLDDRNRQQ